MEKFPKSGVGNGKVAKKEEVVWEKQNQLKI